MAPGQGSRAAHDAALLHAEQDGCVCRGPRVDRLCGRRHGGLACCRGAGHAGLHVACAGQCGPHGILSWGTPDQLAETLRRAAETRA